MPTSMRPKSKAMTNQVFRSGQAVTPRSIVAATVLGELTCDEAADLVELLIEARARSLGLHKPEALAAEPKPQASRRSGNSRTAVGLVKQHLCDTRTMIQHIR